MSDELCYAAVHTTANTTASHCWHPTMLSQMSNPPRHQQRCCYCGHYRFVASPEIELTGHGPYAASPTMRETNDSTENGNGD
jgi:hypothetical protein